MNNSKQQGSVLVNQTQRVDIIDRQTSLSELLVRLDRGDSGIAIAVNNQLVTRDQWSEYSLSNDDSVSIFAAIAGG